MCYISLFKAIYLNPSVLEFPISFVLTANFAFQPQTVTPQTVTPQTVTPQTVTPRVCLYSVNIIFIMSQNMSALCTSHVYMICPGTTYFVSGMSTLANCVFKQS